MKAIDVSNVNGPVNWHRVAREAGIHLAFVKATEGLTFDDSLFPRHRVEAKAAGIHLGAYHFARPDLHDPISEARHFCRVVGKVRVGELRPVLDFETPARLSPSQMQAWAERWCAEVKRILGVAPLFYSYPAFVAAMHPTRKIGVAFWLASYGVNDGREHPFSIPRPWQHVAIHQYTSNGHIPGVSGRVDVSSVSSIVPLLAHPVRGTVKHVAHAVKSKASGLHGIFKS